MFAAKSAKMGLSPWPVMGQAHFSARNGLENEPVPGVGTVASLNKVERRWFAA